MLATVPALLLEAALKGAALFAMVALVTPFLHRKSAAMRHAAWCVAVGVQLLLPALTAVAPAWRVPLVTPPQWSAAVIGARETVRTVEATVTPRGSAPAGAESARPASSSTIGDRNSDSGGARSTLTSIWLIGAGLILLHLAIGTIGVWRVATRSHRILDAEWLALAHELAARVGISRPLTLLRGQSLGIPVTWGVIYPVVLLPADCEAWDEEQRRYVLVHEMAHIRRFDALTDLVGQLTLALYWFNPLVWLAVARMRAEREHACDDYVLRAGTTPSRYANDLLAMICSIGAPHRRTTAPAFGALAMARRSEFEGRMVAILDDHVTREPLSRRGIGAGVIAASMLTLAVAGFSPVAASETPPAPARASSRPNDHPSTGALVAPTAERSSGAPVSRSPSTAPQAERTYLDRALAAMTNESARTALLAQYVMSADDTLVAAALRSVPSLSSDRLKSVVLSNGAPRALRTGNARLRDAFFAAVESMSSDADRTTVLAHAALNVNGSPDVTARVLHAAAGLRSSGASTVLMMVAQRHLLTSDSLRDLYLRVASKLSSDEGRQRALTALLVATPSQSLNP